MPKGRKNAEITVETVDTAEYGTEIAQYIYINN